MVSLLTALSVSPWLVLTTVLQPVWPPARKPQCSWAWLIFGAMCVVGGYQLLPVPSQCSLSTQSYMQLKGWYPGEPLQSCHFCPLAGWHLPYGLQTLNVAAQV